VLFRLSPPRRVLWYGITVFLSSALLLVLEIVAGRLIAPYVDVSLYTWTAIIGVILAGLSLGNWFGGVWADAGADEKAAGITLAVGGLSCLAILVLLMLVAPVIQESRLSLLSASFIYVLALFFLPAVLLGVVTPLLTTLALRLDPRSGHVVGRMHALAALGSIAGTFMTGYWLVQTFGTKNIIVGASLGMFFLAAPFLRGATKLAGEFRYVSVWLDRLPRAPVRQTFVLAVSDAAPFPGRIESQHGIRRSWYRIDEPLAATGTPLPALPVLTDDYVPVERLIAPLLVGEHGL